MAVKMVKNPVTGKYEFPKEEPKVKGEAGTRKVVGMSWFEINKELKTKICSIVGFTSTADTETGKLKEMGTVSIQVISDALDAYLANYGKPTAPPAKK